MVRYGFTLSEVRQLYIDEVIAYFEQLISLLEREGVLKPGTSADLSGDSPVDQLRTQINILKPRL
jgi:hypothetical protein